MLWKNLSPGMKILIFLPVVFIPCWRAGVTTELTTSGTRVTTAHKTTALTTEKLTTIKLMNQSIICSPKFGIFGNGSCRGEKDFIICSQVKSVDDGEYNWSIEPNLTKTESHDSVKFKKSQNGEHYNITLCYRKDRCKDECQGEHIEIEPRLSTDILADAITTEDSITVDCRDYDDFMINATYYFEISRLKSNSTSIKSLHHKNHTITFSNLTSGTLYNITAHGVSKHERNTSSVSRVLITKPHVSIAGCQNELHSIAINVNDGIVKDDDFTKYFDLEYECYATKTCSKQYGKLMLNGLNADRVYNISVQVILKAREFKEDIRVMSDTAFKECHTKIEKPRLITCDRPFEFKEINASTVNVSFPYVFDNHHGNVTYLQIELKKDGNNFNNHSVEIPSSDCDVIKHQLTNLPNGEYEVKLAASNRINQISYSELLKFSLTHPPRGLIVVLVIIIFLLMAVIIILICLMCQCKPMASRNKKKVQISATSSSFSRFIALKARSVKKLSHRISHHQTIRVPIKILDFPAYVETMEKDSGLMYSEEFDDLKGVGRNQPTEDALLQCNRPKNRFVNILPYDATRIKLLPVEDEEGSDYINANWIPGHNSKREFIATQGPLTSTMEDFWRMVWEHNSPAIVMLTLLVEKNKIKCDQYWPSESSTTYGDLHVILEGEIVSEKWCLKIFKLENLKNGETKSVKHFHYLEWPDMNVPETGSLLSFIFFIRENLKDDEKLAELDGPIIVHCSAGVGRSGTYIALETLLKQLENGEDLNVYGTVMAMRMNRILMVQTEQQYVFLYRCMREVVEKTLASNQLTFPSSILQVHEPGPNDNECTDNSPLDHGENELGILKDFSNGNGNTGLGPEKGNISDTGEEPLTCRKTKGHTQSYQTKDDEVELTSISNTE